MIDKHLWAIGALILIFCSMPVRAETVCTIVVDAISKDSVHEIGDCDTRVTPASTFKVPLAIIGFDAEVLTDPHAPRLPFKSGYPDWGGDAWRVDTGPAHWMEHSVVWYSQQIASQLGTDVLTRYARAFGYGNGNFDGDPGFDNGLERAWISSSLTISPREQTVFLAAFLNRELPVSADALDMTALIVACADQQDGWTICGKTGSAYPRKPDRSFDYDRGWGWFVGWALRGGQRLVFAHLIQDNGPVSGSGGIRARSALLAMWPELVQ